MPELLQLIQKRQSSRFLFDPRRKIPKKNLQKILEAARWAPTAHNMQNFEIVVVDDKKLLKKISELRNPISLDFVRENYRQLSFSEAELRRKKVGVLGLMFPAAWRNPKATAKEIRNAGRGSFQERQIGSSSALCIVLYDPKRRAPASAHDFLGAISLGCMLENMWLMAQSLGIGFHVVSALSGGGMEREIKRMLHIPNRFHIALSIRLGYLTAPVKYLRVRRDVKDFAHYNAY
ncbi:MAG: nitroreductase family protein [Candidatus Aminicenantales bacterium]|jgi:nitroreductase